MSSVKKTLIEHLCLYPSLYYCKMAVYDQLFLTIGNGLVWSGGELVDDINNPKRLDKLSVVKIKQTGLDNLKKHFEEHTLYSNYAHKIWKCQIENVLDLIKNDVGVPSYSCFYRIHPGYSLITTIPDDVKPDWFQAIKDFLREYNFFLNSRRALYQLYFMSEVELQQEITLVNDIKKRINQIEANFPKIVNKEYLEAVAVHERIEKTIAEKQGTKVSEYFLCKCGAVREIVYNPEITQCHLCKRVGCWIPDKNTD